MTGNGFQQSFVGESVGWIKEQHTRRFIREKEGRVAGELPLTIFVLGALMAPHMAILGIVLAFATRHDVHPETDASGPQQTFRPRWSAAVRSRPSGTDRSRWRHSVPPR